MTIIYRVGKEDTAAGSFWVEQDILDGAPYYQVFFKRTIAPQHHYLAQDFRDAKHACMYVDHLVRHWLNEYQ